jgi:hypothetical protein
VPVVVADGLGIGCLCPLDFSPAQVVSLATRQHPGAAAAEQSTVTQYVQKQRLSVLERGRYQHVCVCALQVTLT